MSLLTIFLMATCVIDIYSTFMVLVRNGIKIKDFAAQPAVSSKLFMQVTLNILAICTFAYWLIK